MELKNSIILNDATITAASNGCSIDGTTIKLGHNAAGSGLSDFTANRYLYTAGFTLQIGGTAGANLLSLSGTTGSLTLAFDMYVSGIRAGIGQGNIATNTIFGKDILPSNTTGYQNTAIGYQALYTNISGYDNSAYGYYALKTNRYGYRNTAIGGYSSFSNRDGYGNTALGFYSLFSNNDGYYNTAIGYQSLESNIDGYCNVAIGWQAGDYTISGAGNTNPTNCVYIGSGTKSYTNSETNEIIIGYNANGLGSNKAIYGNTSIVRHHLSGTPPATSQYGLLTIGSGAFDGSTSGYFIGSSSGTGLAMNMASGYAGDLMNLQVAGVNVLRAKSDRTVTVYGVNISSAFTDFPLNVHGGMSITSTNSGGDGLGLYQGGNNLTLFINGGGNLATLGKLNIGTTTQSTTYQLGVPLTPTASANYGLVSLGSGAWDGSTSGFFTGSAYGTGLAMNMASGYAGDLTNLQVAGSSKFKVDNKGNVTTKNGIITGTLFTQTATATVANTTTETTLVSTGVGSVTLPADFFEAGKSIVIHGEGIHSATGNPNITIRIKIGGTTYLTTGTVVSDNSTDAYIEIKGTITCRTVGSSGTVMAQGFYVETGGGDNHFGMANTTTQTINTTISNTVDVTVEWGTASANNTFSMTNLLIQGK